MKEPTPISRRDFIKGSMEMLALAPFSRLLTSAQGAEQERLVIDWQTPPNLKEVQEYFAKAQYPTLKPEYLITTENNYLEYGVPIISIVDRSLKTPENYDFTLLTPQPQVCTLTPDTSQSHLMRVGKGSYIATSVDRRYIESMCWRFADAVQLRLLLYKLYYIPAEYLPTLDIPANWMGDIPPGTDSVLDIGPTKVVDYPLPHDNMTSWTMPSAHNAEVGELGTIKPFTYGLEAVYPNDTKAIFTPVLIAREDVTQTT